MQHSPDDRHAAVVAAYDFAAPLVADVGGGNGALLTAILEANPGDTAGSCSTRTAVLAGAHDVLAAADVADRCQGGRPSTSSTPIPVRRGHLHDVADPARLG